MNIRQAILKAADHIERNPGQFNFMAAGVPHPCGSPGCALGWTGHFMGCTDGFNEVCSVMGLAITRPELPELGEFDFYNRMDAINGDNGWRWEASKCAATMRLYADKYHPAEVSERRDLIPASVRAIFQMTTTELAREFQRVE